MKLLTRYSGILRRRGIYKNENWELTNKFASMNFIVKNLIKLNIYSLLLYIACFLVERIYGWQLIHYLRSFLGIILIITFGLNSTALISFLLKRKFTALEFLSIGVVSVIILIPIYLLTLISLFNKYYSYFPFVIISMFALLTLFFLFKKGKNELWKYAEENNKYLTIVIFIVAAVVTIVNFSMYSHLPDLDPYGWVERIETSFKTTQPYLFGGREFFVAFGQFHKDLLGADLQAIFKYLYPLYLLLVLIPLFMIGGFVKNRWSKIIAYLFFLVSPVTILAFNVPMPQLIWLILFYYYVGFLLYSDRKKDDLFFILAGIAALLGIFYHSAFSLLFIFWLVTFLLFYRRQLFKRVEPILLIVLLAFSNFEHAKRIFDFIFKFSKKILFKVINDFSFNFHFPARYVNIDGSQMGWPGMEGVLKYYAYYAGPAAFLISAVFIVLLFVRKDFKFYILEFVKSKGALTLFFVFILFFSLAEIFPRFLNIALLPDRVWVFLGPLFILPLILIFRYAEERKMARSRILSFILILALAISAAGAFYVNWQKSYLITNEQKKAAYWLKKNTEQEVIVFSAGQRNVISGIAGRLYRRVEPDFYFDEKMTNEKLDSKTFENEGDYLTYDDYKKEISGILAETEINTGKSFDAENELRQSVVRILNKTKIFLKSTRPITSSGVKLKYVFYAPPHENNPYTNRPYNRGTQWGFKMEGDFIFDKFPNRFEKIYNQDEVIIWKIN